MTGRRRPRPADTTAVGDRQAPGGRRSTARTPGLTAVPPRRPRTVRGSHVGPTAVPRSMRWPPPSVRRCPVRSPFRVLSSVPKKRTASVHADALVPMFPARAARGVHSDIRQEQRCGRRRGRCRVRCSSVFCGVSVSELLSDPRPGSAVTSKREAPPQPTVTRARAAPGNADSRQRSHRSRLSDVAAGWGPSPAPSPGRRDR